MADLLCCDQQARTASAQNFTLWKQAIIEITRRDHSIIACSRHIYLCVALCAHPNCAHPNRTFNTTSTERLQQRPLLFAVNRVYRTFFFLKLHLTKHWRQVCKASHFGKATIEIQKSNNRDPTSWSFYFCCWRHILYIWVLLFTYIPFVANRTFNTTLTEWLQHLQQSWARLFEMTKSERDK